MADSQRDSFGVRARFDAPDGRTLVAYRLDRLPSSTDIGSLPFSLKVLLENLLRHEDGTSVTAADIEALTRWEPTAEPRQEISFAPARVLLQDFTGVPAVVDLAAMRDAMAAMGGDPDRVNPLIPAELVIDHSVVADVAGVPEAFARNAALEFDRNRERYQFLRWGQMAFDNFKVVPPDTGICHQVNLEYLSRVVFVEEGSGLVFPDTLVGTDSHTTMVNGLGVLGWGVGGIEAEAALLGQPVSMLVPRVVGFKLTGALPDGATATDLVLTVTELLRRHGVVGKFVEFYGEGVAAVPLENRATIGNMSPEYGSTCAIFPIDDETLRYLAFTGRPAAQVALVEAYARAQGLWHDPAHEPRYSEYLELDLSTVEPSLAGPARPQDRVPVDSAKAMFRVALSGERLLPATPPTEGAAPTRSPVPEPGERLRHPVPVTLADGSSFEIDHGHVVIAAITSCTNTSNPSVMIAAGLLAKNAVERGLVARPWVKTSLAPGSKVVIDYYERSGLMPYLEKLGFGLVGYGCTTCIGNSGPLKPELSDAVERGSLAVVAVLSGNRNFEGRINADVRMNYLASPPLVVAYALAGTMDIDLRHEPLGTDGEGRPVYLRDVWPSAHEVSRVVSEAIASDMYRKSYDSVFEGDDNWNGLQVPTGQRYARDDASTYVRNPPYFEAMGITPSGIGDVHGARVLAKLGHSVTTDHISPAGSIRRSSPAGRWLEAQGVAPADFNSYGSRRGNHEVMIRGTFANIRLRNQLAPGTEGGVTRHLPDGEEMSIYDAAVAYQAEEVPLVVLAGKDYGSGSSRDWAAKGTRLLGVRAVLAQSFERIHRSNLVGMGVLPLQFKGDTVASLGLTGEEVFDITGLEDLGREDRLPDELVVTADGREFRVRLRIDTPKEEEYYRHGGILHYVLRQLAAQAGSSVPRGGWRGGILRPGPHVAPRRQRAGTDRGAPARRRGAQPQPARPGADLPGLRPLRGIPGGHGAGPGGRGRGAGAVPGGAAGRRRVGHRRLDGEGRPLRPGPDRGAPAGRSARGAGHDDPDGPGRAAGPAPPTRRRDRHPVPDDGRRSRGAALHRPPRRRLRVGRGQVDGGAVVGRGALGRAGGQLGVLRQRVRHPAAVLGRPPRDRERRPPAGGRRHLAPLAPAPPRRPARCPQAHRDRAVRRGEDLGPARVVPLRPLRHRGHRTPPPPGAGHRGGQPSQLLRRRGHRAHGDAQRAPAPGPGQEGDLRRPGARPSGQGSNT